MYDENQMVEMKWVYQNRTWYEEKGYKFNGWHNVFYVAAKDLMPHSASKINVTCDCCGRIYNTEYALVTNGREKHSIDMCRKCVSKATNNATKLERAKKYIGLARSACKEKDYILLTMEEDYTNIKMSAVFFVGI